MDERRIKKKRGNGKEIWPRYSGCCLSWWWLPAWVLLGVSLSLLMRNKPPFYPLAAAAVSKDALSLSWQKDERGEGGRGREGECRSQKTTKLRSSQVSAPSGGNEIDCEWKVEAAQCVAAYMGMSCGRLIQSEDEGVLEGEVEGGGVFTAALCLHCRQD